MKTHGMSRTRLYRAWWDMKCRCTRNHEKYIKNYQERGITVCKEWDDSFEAFRDWALANGYKEGLSLDRKDVDGNYEPSNCKWSTRVEQANNRTDSHFLEFQGQTKSVADWARELQIPKSTIFHRLRDGWSIERALSTPSDKRFDKGTMIEFQGVTRSVPEWADELGITKQSLFIRLKNGWSIEKALTTPRGKTGPRRSKQEI